MSGVSSIHRELIGFLAKETDFLLSSVKSTSYVGKHVHGDGKHGKSSDC